MKKDMIFEGLTVTLHAVKEDFPHDYDLFVILFQEDHGYLFDRYGQLVRRGNDYFYRRSDINNPIY